LVDQVLARLKEQGVEVPASEVEPRLKMLVENFKVPEGEARRSVMNYFLKEHGITPSKTFSREGARVKVGEINESGRWVDLNVKVLQLWQPTTDAISQTGLIADESGKIKFTKWSRDNLPMLEEGKSYSIKSAVTDEFQGRFGIKLTKNSKISALDVEIEAQAASAPAEPVKIADIKESGRWIDLKAKIVQLWQPTTDAVSQTGLIADESGKIKFTKWSRDNLPMLEEGKSYLIESAVTDEFQGRFSIKLTKNSKISPLEEDVETRAASAPAQPVKVVDINESGRWIDLKAKVVQLWESTSDSISQSGLIGDETGTIKFVKWSKAGLPDLEEGKSYHFQNLVTDEFQGRFSVKFNRTSQLSPLDEDVEVGSQSTEFTGAMVDVQKGSGLIKRCPICRRSLAKGICGEHGKVEGAYDLRIKAVLDDGRRVQDILLNRETTEKLVGLTLDEAKSMAMEALDHEVVRSLIEERLVGRYYSVTGPRVDRYILVESISEAPPVSEDEVDDLIMQAEVA